MTPFQIVDSLLIIPFRQPGSPEAGLLFGIFLLALFSAGLGIACSALVGRMHRTRQLREDGEAHKRSELSFQALQSGDKKAYLAQNHLAQEAYGNTMALSAGRAAGLLWPACASLAWLCWRFEGVPMPFLWSSAGPASYFLPMFIGALWGLSRLKRKIIAAPPPERERGV